MYHQSPSRHRYIAFPEHLFMERDTHLWLFGRWRTKEAQMKLTIPAILITALMVAPPAALAQRGGADRRPNSVLLQHGKSDAHFCTAVLWTLSRRRTCISGAPLLSGPTRLVRRKRWASFVLART